LITRIGILIPSTELIIKIMNIEITAGIDEAGRGPLAGPVVAAAVIMDPNRPIAGIKDSKKLSFAKRENLYQQITENYIWSVGIISPFEIDKINILEATKKAMQIAAKGLKIEPSVFLVDGNMKFPDPRFISIIKGDDTVPTISAASIIAKVTRDRIMLDLATSFPEYLWHKNFGYGTKEHMDAIVKYGLTQHHRQSFKSKKDTNSGLSRSRVLQSSLA